MKRTMSQVALETTLYTISGNQKIKILDNEGTVNQPIYKTVFEGRAYDYRAFKPAYCNLYLKAAVHGIDVSGEYLVFTLMTYLEEYSDRDVIRR